VQWQQAFLIVHARADGKAVAQMRRHCAGRGGVEGKAAPHVPLVDRVGMESEQLLYHIARWNAVAYRHVQRREQ
jgi:hypothetical protein